MEQKLDESQFDIIRKALELLTTVGEALHYLAGNTSVTAEDESSTIEMFRDVCNALAGIDGSLAEFTQGIDDEQLVAAAFEMVDAMSDIAGMLERQETAAAGELIGRKLLPAYGAWAQRLRIHMEPKIVC